MTVPQHAAALEVAHGIWAVPMALPRGFSRASWSYLIDDGSSGLTLVDPGWNLGENWGSLERALKSLAFTPSDIGVAFSTHAHRDHFGLSGRLRRSFGVRIVMHENERSHVREQIAGTSRTQQRQLESWGVPPVIRAELSEQTAGRLAREDGHIDATLSDGDPVPGMSDDWTVLATPGHTSGSSCLVSRSREIMFTGDHLLPGESPGIGLGGEFDRNPFDLMRESLAAMVARDRWTALPGHGAPFTNVSAEARAILHHHSSRRQQVADVVAASSRPLSVWDIAERIDWRGGFKNLSPRRLLLALHHIDVYQVSLSLVSGGEISTDVG